MRFVSLFIFLLGLVSWMIPSRGTAFSNVLINEIAWMGTSVSSANEWIELMNPTDNTISLQDWTMRGNGGPAIELSGSIAPKSFYIIERTDDDTIPEIPADLITSFGSGTGAGLSNTGETLELKDASGALVDTATWTADGPGDMTTKQTMQRQNDGSWSMSTKPNGTPRATNSVWIVPTPLAQAPLLQAPATSENATAKEASSLPKDASSENSFKNSYALRAAPETTGSALAAALRDGDNMNDSSSSGILQGILIAAGVGSLVLVLRVVEKRRWRPRFIVEKDEIVQ